MKKVPLRFVGLPRHRHRGLDLPVAESPLARLLGLALLDREQAGPGLLIPNCSSVHSFGMRFPLRICFLDRDGQPIRTIDRLLPRRLCGCHGASAVLELVPEEER